jgi:hypothetical protein
VVHSSPCEQLFKGSLGDADLGWNQARSDSGKTTAIYLTIGHSSDFRRIDAVLLWAIN